MNTLLIIAVTLFSYWALGCIVYLCSKQNDQVGALWGMGLVFWILWILFYPVRVIRIYNMYEEQYREHGISRIQYFFGRRIKHDKN